MKLSSAKTTMLVLGAVGLVVGLGLVCPGLREILLAQLGREVGQTGQDLLLLFGVMLGAGSVLLMAGAVLWPAPEACSARVFRCLGSLTPSRWVFFVFALAVALRLAWVAGCPVVQFSDFKAYDELGAGLARDGSYRLEGRPSAIYAPGYPLLLSGVYRIFGHRHFPAKVANASLGGALVLAVYLLAREAGGESSARWASFLAAIYPPLVSTASLLASENLFIPLLVFGLWFFLRGTRTGGGVFFVLAGVFLGLASLVRTGIYLLPVLLGIWLLFRGPGKFSGRILRALLLVLCLSAIVFPWLRRNRVVFGDWGIMGTSLGWTFYDTNTDHPFPAKLALADSLLRETDDEYRVDRELFRRGLDFVRGNPGCFLRNLVLGKARAYLLGSPEWLSQYNLKRNPDWPSRKLNLLYFALWGINSFSYYLLLLLALAGIFSGFRRCRYSLLFLLVIGYNLGLLVISKGLPRYRLAVIPILIFFPSLFIEKLKFTYRDVESQNSKSSASQRTNFK